MVVYNDNISLSTEKNKEPLPLVGVFYNGKEFLQPYFKRQFEDYEIDGDIFAALFEKRPLVYAIMISDADIYNRSEGESLTEDEPADQLSPIYKHEQDFVTQCKESSIPYLVLRTANVVATGMNGFPRKMVNGIYRGVYFNIKGNESMMSAVHGVDVAGVAYKAIRNNVTGIYNCVSPELYQISMFASALGFRMNQKKVFSLPLRWARMIYGKSYFYRLTHTLTFSSQRLTDASGYTGWHNVIDYLQTHVYDHESL